MNSLPSCVIKLKSTMKLTDLSSRTTDWFNGAGPMADIVISSRIRLARNIAKAKFTSRCSDEEKQHIMDMLAEVATELDQLGKLSFVNVEKLSTLERSFLVERQLISRNLAAGSGPRGVVIAADELFSAMLNEEDHLRMQVLASGLDLEKCWDKINRIDDFISQTAKYAFHRQYGYLTACPTNVGTGIRVSVMLHLPGLKMTDQLKKVFDAVKDMNLTVRGMFGEGTEAVGDFFQVSNQVTLGVKEERIIENFSKVIIPKIVEYERLSREKLLNEDITVLEDKISRAMALLKNARLISSHEALFLLSNLRLGVNIGIIKDLSIAAINELFMLTQPSHLQLNHGSVLTAEQRDMLRAQKLKAKLN